MKAELADQLVLLSLIEQYGSLTAAGEVLGLTPPAVSQRLARIEDRWGAQLVERGPRGATLTAAGVALAVHGRRIEREVEDARTSFPAYRQGLVRRLRVGAFQAAALHLLPPAMTALRHQVDDVDLSVIDIQSSDAIDLVSPGSSTWRFSPPGTRSRQFHPGWHSPACWRTRWWSPSPTTIRSPLPAGRSP